MMRVLQAMAGAAHGGAEAFFERLAVALHRAGLRQRLLIRRYPGREALFRQAGIEPLFAPFGGPLDLATPHLFRKAVREFAPDVVLTWQNRATRLCPKGRFVHVARLGGYYDLKYYRGADHLIANTEDIRRYLIEAGWPAERVHFLPNFVHGAEAGHPEPREPYQTPADAPLLLALGRLHVNKGFDTLLRALTEIPRAHLWIAGEGPEESALRELGAQLRLTDRVHYLGWRTDIAPLFAACDVFVCPSRHEPLGNVVLDAFAHRRPVVATRAAGPAMLIADGESGLLTPVDDAPSIAAAVRRMLADSTLRARCAEAGHALWSRNYSEPVVVAGYLALFESLAAAAPSRQRSFVG